MKKITVLLLLFLFLTPSLFPADIETLCYRDLVEMTYVQQLCLVEGFILGGYAAGYLANRSYGMSEEAMNAMVISGFTVEQVLKQTLQWYRITGKYDTPIFVAIYRRNIDAGGF
jgi:hypothetical protein